MHYITTNCDGFFVERSAIDCSHQSGPAGPSIRVDETARKQEMLGFGAALTDSACWMISRLPEDRRSELLEEVYGAGGMGFNVGRVCVGSSDYAREPYCHDPVPGDVELRHFSLDYDRQYILPILRQARAVSAGLFLYSSPWSPPGWMKSSGDMQGGWMLEKYVEVYARYYMKFLEGYRAEGVRLNGLTPQNETETDQVGRMPACLWHPDLEMKFARAIRPMLEETGFAGMKIWLMDHNYIMWKRAKYMLDDPATREAVDGIAWHHYEGTPEMMEWLQQCHPSAEMHWTEGGPGLGEGKYSTDFAPWADTFLKAIRAGCQSITAWNLALDQYGYPNVGHFNCAGTLTIDRDTLAVSRSAQYYALGHFSKYIQRGARRLESAGCMLPGHINHAAFENPDGSHVLVISNTQNVNQWVNIEISGKALKLWVLRESVSTLVW